MLFDKKMPSLKDKILEEAEDKEKKKKEEKKRKEEEKKRGAGRASTIKKGKK